MQKSTQLCAEMCVLLFVGAPLLRWDKDNRCVHDKKLKSVHVDLFLLLHTHSHRW